MSELDLYHLRKIVAAGPSIAMVPGGEFVHVIDEALYARSRERQAILELVERFRGHRTSPVDDILADIRDRTTEPTTDAELEGLLDKIKRLEKRVEELEDAEGMPVSEPVDAVLAEIRNRYNGATAAWPPFNSAHEAWGVLSEEMEEVWAHVRVKQKNRDLAAMREEAIDVAAMALRFALEVCDEERGRR